jgi:hypothetical protein
VDVSLGVELDPNAQLSQAIRADSGVGIANAVHKHAAEASALMPPDACPQR